MKKLDALIKAIQESGIKKLTPFQIVRLVKLFTVGTWLSVFSLLFGVIGGTGLIMAWVWGEPSPERPPKEIVIERTEAIRIGDSGQPSFVWDHAYVLNTPTGREYARNYLVWSEVLRGYDPFCWSVDAGNQIRGSPLVTARAAYLVRSANDLSYTPLSSAAGHNNYRVSGSAAGDRLLFVVRIERDEPIPDDDVKQLLATVVLSGSGCEG